MKFLDAGIIITIIITLKTSINDTSIHNVIIIIIIIIITIVISRKKFEIATNEPGNPIKQDVKKGYHHHHPQCHRCHHHHRCHR